MSEQFFICLAITYSSYLYFTKIVFATVTSSLRFLYLHSLKCYENIIKKQLKDIKAHWTWNHKRPKLKDRLCPLSSLTSHAMNKNRIKYVSTLICYNLVDTKKSFSLNNMIIMKIDEASRYFMAGVFKLQPAGRIWPASVINPARDS